MTARTDGTKDKTRNDNRREGRTKRMTKRSKGLVSLSGEGASVKVRAKETFLRNFCGSK